MKYNLSVVLGVLVKEDMVLISRRKRRDRLGGEWELPGGRKEPGETNFDTLRRELKEEIIISDMSAIFSKMNGYRICPILFCK